MRLLRRSKPVSPPHKMPGRRSCERRCGSPLHGPLRQNAAVISIFAECGPAAGTHSARGTCRRSWSEYFGLARVDPAQHVIDPTFAGHVPLYAAASVQRPPASSAPTGRTTKPLIVHPLPFAGERRQQRCRISRDCVQDRLALRRRYAVSPVRGTGRDMVETSEVLQWAATVSLTAAALGCLYLVFVGFSVLRFRRGEQAPAPVAVPVSVLEPDVPAIDVVRKGAAERNDGRLVCHVDSHVAGQNLKVANIANIAKHAKHEMLVLIDSDIVVKPNYLAGVVAELQRPGVGAVTCLFYGIAQENLWSRLAAMSVNAHFLPNVIGGVTLGLARPCFGATIALTRDILWRIGGVAAFADQLWDDYAIGDAIRGAGYTVAVAPFAVGHVQTAATARQLAEHQVRLGCTIKS